MSSIRSQLVKTLTASDAKRIVASIDAHLGESETLDDAALDYIIVDAIEKRQPGEQSDSAPTIIYVPAELLETVARANEKRDIIVLPTEAFPQA